VNQARLIGIALGAKSKSPYYQLDKTRRLLPKITQDRKRGFLLRDGGNGSFRTL
jgi:hypothetical protein